MRNSSNPKISVLIPVYNGVKYLRKTLESIRAQTFPEYETVCVNDCSTDDSLSILEDYQAIDPRFRVFSTSANLGTVPRVLNYVIPQVRGDYIFYLSQDDLLSADCLQSMLERAVSTGADATIPDLVLYYEDEPHKNTILTAPGGDKSRILTNREAVILSLDWSIPANALYVSRLLKEIRIFDFAMNSDEYTSRVYFFNCNKIVFCNGTFYYRQDNPEAITKKLSAGTFDYPYTDFRLFQFLRENEFPRDAQESVLLRSIRALSDSRNYLSEYEIKRLLRRQATCSFNVEEADRRLRRCFDALRRDEAPARLAELKSWKALCARMMLANYTWFRAISFITIGLRAAKSKVRAAARWF